MEKQINFDKVLRDLAAQVANLTAENAILRSLLSDKEEIEKAEGEDKPVGEEKSNGQLLLSEAS